MESTNHQIVTVRLHLKSVSVSLSGHVFDIISTLLYSCSPNLICEVECCVILSWNVNCGKSSVLEIAGGNENHYHYTIIYTKLCK